MFLYNANRLILATIIFMKKLNYFILFFLSGCIHLPGSFDKEFYQSVSGIKLPDEYNVLESVDNLEFVTGTVFSIDSLTLVEFSRKNHFDSLKDGQNLNLFSEAYFQKHKPSFKGNRNILFVQGEKGENRWLYVADVKNKRLWAEIVYPD